MGELVEEEHWVGGAGKRSLRSAFWRKRRQSIYQGRVYVYFFYFLFFYIYFADVENCENFRGFGYIYIYIYICILVIGSCVAQFNEKTYKINVK